MVSSNNSSIVQMTQLPQHNPAQFGAPGTYQYQSLTNLGVSERDSLGLEKVLSLQQQVLQGAG